MKINLIGQRNHLGFGTHYSGFVDSFKKLSLLKGIAQEYDAFSQEGLSSLSRLSHPSDINVWFSGFMSPQSHQARGRNIVWAIFEHTSLSRAYISMLERADLVWVPSEWGKTILINCGLQEAKVNVVPEGVDPQAFHPFCRNRQDPKREKFRFLMFGKYEERKGYNQLLNAFKEAFENNPNVELWIKGDYFIDHQRKHELLDSKIQSMKCSNIKLVPGLASRDEIFTLLNLVDAFVFPSRAEGWGLPLIEALATGLPTLAVYYSGQTEYLKHLEGKFLPIKFDLVPISDPEFKQFQTSDGGDFGVWAEASVGDLAENMYHFYDHQIMWREKALKASAVVREKFSWDRSVDIALESMITSNLLPAPKFIPQ